MLVYFCGWTHKTLKSATRAHVWERTAKNTLSWNRTSASRLMCSFRENFWRSNLRLGHFKSLLRRRFLFILFTFSYNKIHVRCVRIYVGRQYACRILHDFWISRIFVLSNLLRTSHHRWFLPRLRLYVSHHSFSTGWSGLIYMIYLLTAIGLSPGDISTVHIYTQTVHRTTQNKQYTEQHNNLGESGPCAVLTRFTLAFALQLRKKHGKTSVRVAASKNT